jgi:hypothetical protein
MKVFSFIRARFINRWGDILWLVSDGERGRRGEGKKGRRGDRESAELSQGE